MPTAILIAFEYRAKPLPGAIIDLYHAWNWCKSFECHVCVITDITGPTNVNNLHDAIARGIAEPDVLTFYDNMPKIIVGDDMNFLHSIDLSLERQITDNKLVIYYSGHGIKNAMVLPDGKQISFLEFRDYILNNISPNVEIFWILDCCNPNGLHLPCKLVGNKFEILTTDVEYVAQPILLLTSAEPYEKSIATPTGSVFTRHLFRILTLMNYDDNVVTVKAKTAHVPHQKNRNLRRLMGNLMTHIRGMDTGHIQTVSIYASYIMDPVLWMWVGSNRTYNLSVHRGLSAIIIRRQ